MIILAQLNRDTFDIISYDVVDDIPVTYNYANYYQRGYVFDSENQLNKSRVKFIIIILILRFLYLII